MKVKKLHPEAIIPKYATKGAACFDLYTINSNPLCEGRSNVYGTGLSFEIPEDHVMLVFSRSGHGFKHGIRLSNCVGVIDSDFRGEVMVKLHMDINEFDSPEIMKQYIEAGDRIAQAMVIPVKQVTFEEVDELGTTDRGSGGFGSTGK